MKTFFVYLDILGFKNIVFNNTEQRLQEIIVSFFAGFNNAIDNSRTITFTNTTDKTTGTWKISLNELNFRLLSDSILIWAENENFNTFRNLLGATSQLITYGLQNGFPLRGAMTYGEIIVQKQNDTKNNFFSNESIYGKALVETYSLEGKMNWSGCIITSNAWKKIHEIWNSTLTNDPNPNAYFSRYPYLVWYPIPFKDSPQAGIAINWNVDVVYDSAKKIDPYLVRNSFYTHGKEFQPDSSKIDETLKFLEYTNQLQSYCFCQSTLDFENRRQTIPTPCANYKL